MLKHSSWLAACLITLAAWPAYAQDGYGIEDVNPTGWALTGVAVIGAFIAAAIRPWAAFLVYFLPLLTAVALYRSYTIHAGMADLPAEYIGDVTGAFTDQAVRLALEVIGPCVAFFMARERA